MADTKYAKFLIETAFKLAFFLVACTGVRMLCMKFMSAPAHYIVPSAFAMLLTWFMLTAAEGNKRSFFSRGYMVSNIVPGMLWGLGVSAVGPVIGLLLGAESLKVLPDGFDLRIPFYASISTEFFYALVIFGYFFHILQHDFGAIPTVLITSVIYGFLSAVDKEGIQLLMGDGAKTEFIIYAVSCAVVGSAAGMLILALGDMRSAAAFLFMKGVCDCFAANMFVSVGSGSFIADFAGPILALICGATMFSILRKDL